MKTGEEEEKKKKRKGEKKSKDEKSRTDEEDEEATKKEREQKNRGERKKKKKTRGEKKKKILSLVSVYGNAYLFPLYRVGLLSVPSSSFSPLPLLCLFLSKLSFSRFLLSSVVEKTSSLLFLLVFSQAASTSPSLAFLHKKGEKKKERENKYDP